LFDAEFVPLGNSIAEGIAHGNRSALRDSQLSGAFWDAALQARQIGIGE
jgi:hypothetical protein